jgi:DNA-binding Lrp family transcriptional regulator
MMDAIDRTLVNRLQDGVDVVAEPFAALAAELGVGQDEIAARLKRLCDDGVLSRFGPLYDAARMGGAVTLCAMAVPRERFEAVAAFVNAMPEVAHNYERAHHFNMWFVLAAERSEEIAAAVTAIAAGTGLAVIDLPKLTEYRLDLRLAV